jgi:prepilin-type N-terminal cleavage/methylation domain-containing protein
MSPVRVPAKNHPRGFTLIELLVVIFIIGILIAATLTIIPKVKMAVYGAETNAQLAALATAIQQYYNDCKSYPGPLPNNQLNWAADSVNGNIPTIGGHQLTAQDPFPQPQYNPIAANFYYNITGSQNLVLGLLGGLELQYTGGAVSGFAYNPLDILSDGVTPSPHGPSSLNPANPRRQQAYIQVKPGELSVPNTTYNSGAGASFVDSTGNVMASLHRSPVDAMIPVFLDKYSDPMPILYYRTNAGGTAIVGLRNLTASGGSYVDDSQNLLIDSSSGTPGPAQVPQYDLVGNLPYTNSLIETSMSKATSYHGLEGCGTSANLSDPIDVKNADGTYSPYTPGSNNPITTKPNGFNGIAYFKDPTLNGTYDATVSPAISNVHAGIARQKDAFILISAGPDRLYGTHDDQINPGPLQP